MLLTTVAAPSGTDASFLVQLTSPLLVLRATICPLLLDLPSSLLVSCSPSSCARSFGRFATGTYTLSCATAMFAITLGVVSPTALIVVVHSASEESSEVSPLTAATFDP